MEITTASQTEAASYRYTPYGAVTITRGGSVQSSDPLGQHWGFTARFHDAETGLTYFRARYQDPATGRFLQRDPLGSSGAAGPYQYCASRPIALLDPLGEEERDPFDPFRPTAEESRRRGAAIPDSVPVAGSDLRLRPPALPNLGGSPTTDGSEPPTRVDPAGADGTALGRLLGEGPDPRLPPWLGPPGGVAPPVVRAGGEVGRGLPPTDLLRLFPPTSPVHPESAGDTPLGWGHGPQWRIRFGSDDGPVQPFISHDPLRRLPRPGDDLLDGLGWGLTGRFRIGAGRGEWEIYRREGQGGWIGFGFGFKFMVSEFHPESWVAGSASSDVGLATATSGATRTASHLRCRRR
jgi:RHS repeat-associated protein